MADIDRNALAVLIEAVEAGDDAGFRRANRSVFSTPCQDMALQLREEHCRHAYKGSLDAAKALHEALLPGWDWCIQGESASVYSPEDNSPVDCDDKQTCPARAWLIAILRAVEGGE